MYRYYGLTSLAITAAG